MPNLIKKTIIFEKQNNYMRQKIVFSKKEMIEIISQSQTCFVAMVDKEGNPYNLPFNFGFDDNYIYIHSGKEGKKNEILKNNPNVCIAFSNSEKLAFQSEKVACSHFMRYKSVLVCGKLEFIEDLEEKSKILNIFMKHYTGKDDYKYGLPALKNVAVYKLSNQNMSGRTYGY